jgi:dihydroflavonol-4-reductase
MIGANLVRRLLEEGHQVRALVYGDRRALDGLDIEQIECDVRDYDALRDALRGCDQVYHLAAVITSADRTDPIAEDINVNGPRNVTRACMEVGVKRLLHCSSIHALRPNDDRSIVDETRPLSLHPEAFPYDRSKAMGHTVVLEAIKEGLDAVIVHPTAVIGPHDYGLASTSKGLVDFVRGKVPAMPNGGFDFVDARDVVNGMVAAMERGRTGENYLLGGKYYDMTELCTILAGVVGCKPPRFTIPIWVMRVIALALALKPQKPGRIEVVTKFTVDSIIVYREVSHEKAVRELGYSARPIEETLRDTFDWFAEAGMVELPAKAQG